MNDYTFGNFLFELRSEKGISQSQLGEMLGVTNKAVSKWENGNAKPNTNLIPRIAEIFGVTVEELFACKRFEKDSEIEKIKEYLAKQKKKYAILSSLFLAVIIILPLLMSEFICIVMGYKLPDDILGPLGAVGFIIAFIVSITAYIIYRKNFKHAISPSELTHSSRFVETVEKGLVISAISWWLIFSFILPIYLWVLDAFSLSFAKANIILLIIVFILIMLFGGFIFFVNIKRLLKIKFSNTDQKETKRIPFSKLPVWGKICYVAVIILFPIVINFYTLSFFNKDLTLLRIISTSVFCVCIFLLVLYRMKKKK